MYYHLMLLIPSSIATETYLLVVLSILPVTTSTLEGTFSVLCRLKTYLSNMKSQTQLTGIAHLCINRDVPCSKEEVINNEATSDLSLTITG